MIFVKEKHSYTIDITPRSIAFFTFIPLALFLLWTVRDIIFSLLIGFILMSALRPGVHYLMKKKLSRPLSVFIIYISFILVFLSLISLIIPPIIIETTNLFRSFPTIIENISPQISGYIDVKDIGRYIPNFTNNIFNIISGVFSNTLFVVSTLFFGLYFLLEEKLLEDVVCRYCRADQISGITNVLRRSEERMASWFWGEMTLMTVVGLMTFIGLNILGIRYALPLAVLAGLMEIVPNIGPTISAVPAVIIGLGSSYFTGFSALALYLIIQQFENSIIVPYIMRRAVGLNPILTLIALLVGGRIGGVLGVLLAIPLVLFIETILAEVFHFQLTFGKEKKDDV
ncbi:AI-2E family transporter [soil metagenome]